MAVVLNINHSPGDFSEYDSAQVDGGDLSVVAPGLARSAFKTQFLIDDTTKMQAALAFSFSGTVLRTRFYYSIDSGFSYPEGDNMRVFRLASTLSPFDLFDMRLRGEAGSTVDVQLNLRKDGTNAGQTFITAPTRDIDHFFEVYYIRATSDVAADGEIYVWHDNVLVTSITSVDNYDIFNGVTALQVQADFIEAGASGMYYFDEFVINDDGSRIGPVPFLQNRKPNNQVIRNGRNFGVLIG